MAAHITVPLTALTVKSYGPFVSGVLPSTLAGYSIEITNDASWPTNGKDAFTLVVEQSNDSGATWVFDASATFVALPFKDRQGAIINSATWWVSLANEGSTTRKVRISAKVLQACSLGFVVTDI